MTPEQQAAIERARKSVTLSAEQLAAISRTREAIGANATTETGDQRVVSPSGRSLPAGSEVIGTFDGRGEIIRLPDGTLNAVSDGVSTTDQADIQRLMAGDSYAEIARDDLDQHVLDSVPAWASRGQEVVRGVPVVGSYVDELYGAINPELGQTSRMVSDAMQRQHPVQSAGLNILGSIASTAGLAAGANVPNFLRSGGKVSQAVKGALVGATAGATEGAIYGAGEGTDFQSRSEEALRGGAWGGGLGGVAGGAAPSIGRLGERIANGFARSDVSTIAQELDVSKNAATVIRNALRTGDDLQVDELQAYLARAGDDAALVDAGPALQQVLDAAAQSGGPATATIRRALDERVSGATQAMTDALDRRLGQAEGIGALTDRIRLGTQEARGAAYNAAYETPINYAEGAGQRVEALLQRVPEAAIRKANELMALEGLQSRQILAQIGEDGAVSYFQMPDVRQIDYITRALNDVAQRHNGQGALGGTTDLGRVTAGLSREIRNSLGEAVPAYREALNVAADAISRRNATDLGNTLFRSSTTREDVARALNGATEAERAAMREGLRSHIDEVTANVRRTITDGDVEARGGIQILREFSSPANQTKLRMLLGVDEADRMLAEIDQAATAFELRAALATNSKTAVRQSVNGSIAALTTPGVLGTLKEGEAADAIKRIVQVLTGEGPEAAAARSAGVMDEIARALTEKRGSDAQRAVLLITQAIDGQPLRDDQAAYVATQLLSHVPVAIDHSVPPWLSPE